MPAAVTAVLAFEVVAGVTIGGILFNVAASLALNALFAPRQKGLSAPNLRDQPLTLTQLAPAAPWDIVYGQVRKGGTVVFRHATDTKNLAQAVASEVIPHSSPYTVTINGPTFPSKGPWDSNVSVVRREYIEGDGDYIDTTMTAVGGAPAAGQYSVAAGVYTFAAADAGKSMQITYMYRKSIVAHNRLHLVIVLAAHECEEIGDIYFGDEIVPLDGSGNATGRYANHVFVAKHLGADAQAADATLMAEAPDKWTANHRLRGHAYLYVRLIRNNDLFPGGVPNISAMVKGRKVYDPRSGLTVWSANAALCIADYMASSRFGLGAAYATEIDNTLLSAAANVCDEDVALAAGGTEDRYTCNGVVNTATKPQEVIERMLTAMAGRVVYIGGKWRFRAGAYITPALTLDEGDLRGPIRVNTRLSRRETCNGVKGVYISSQNNWQPSDFPPVASAAYMAEDNGERIWKDIELPFTTSPATAQRIAKIELLRARQQISADMPCKMAAYQAEPPETLMLDNTRFGWSGKAFEIVESRLVFGESDLGVDLSLRETAASIYDWSTSEESAVDTAPDTDLPNPFAVAPPGIPAVTEQLYETTGSAGVKVRGIVSWAPSPDGQAWRYELQWKKKADAEWQAHQFLDGSVDLVPDLEATVYQFRVRAINTIGVKSEWSQVEKEIIGLSAPPASVAGFSVIKSSGVGIAQWTLHSDLDVQINGVIVIRHSPLTSGAMWNDGIIVEEFPGGLISGIVPLITGTYMAKARDSSGNYSVSEVSFVATEGMVTGFTTVGTSTQHPSFTGAKTNVALDTTLAGIKLDSTTLIDSMVTNVDSWPFIDSIGGVSGTGSYAFDTHIDLATVGTRRFEADIKALSFDTNDLIDDRTDPVDEWGPIDGNVINDCDVTLYARTTNDDPAGSPVWGAWTPFFVSDFTCRAAQLKLDFVSGLVTHNIIVTELAVHVKQPA